MLKEVSIKMPVASFCFPVFIYTGPPVEIELRLIFKFPLRHLVVIFPKLMIQMHSNIGKIGLPYRFSKLLRLSVDIFEFGLIEIAVGEDTVMEFHEFEFCANEKTIDKLAIAKCDFSNLCF